MVWLHFKNLEKAKMLISLFVEGAIGTGTSSGGGGGGDREDEQ